MYRYWQDISYQIHRSGIGGHCACRSTITRYSKCHAFRAKETFPATSEPGDLEHDGDHGSFCEHQALSGLVVGTRREPGTEKAKELGRQRPREKSVLCGYTGLRQGSITLGRHRQHRRLRRGPTSTDRVDGSDDRRRLDQPVEWERRLAGRCRLPSDLPQYVILVLVMLRRANVCT